MALMMASSGTTRPTWQFSQYLGGLMRFTTGRRADRTADIERLASDELGSLKIKNPVDNLAYLAHATDRMQAGKEFMGFRGVHRA